MTPELIGSQNALIDLDKAGPVLALFGSIGLGVWLVRCLLEWVTRLIKGVLR